MAARRVLNAFESYLILAIRLPLPVGEVEMVEPEVRMKSCMKLRSHRYDSIKLMLAWEHVLPLLPFLFFPPKTVELLTATA
jgi:hypothetical protein